MKTRTLLLLSLGCAIAIALAGVALLFQINTADQPPPAAAPGDVVTVGDMVVIVKHTVEGSNGTLAVTVELGGADDPDPADDFGLIAAGRPVTVNNSDCQPTSVDSRNECTIEFVVGVTDGDSRVLFYERGEEQARWLLEPSA